MLLHVSDEIGSHQLTGRIKMGETSSSNSDVKLYKIVISVILIMEWQQ
jgi:hypothetical protein